MFNPFTRRTTEAYSQTDLSDIVTDLKELHRLRDQCIQAERLYTKLSPEERQQFLREAEAYTRDIRATQERYDYMLSRVQPQAGKEGKR